MRRAKEDGGSTIEYVKGERKVPSDRNLQEITSE
jgi:hypothetical protein